MPLGVSADKDLCVGGARWQEACYWNHAFAIVIKEQPPSTWPWHDNWGRTTVSWSRVEVRSPFTTAALNHYNESSWKSSRNDLSKGFLAIVISFPGSQLRPNEGRQALASAVCYGSLMYTRWKGSLLLKHGWRNKDRNEQKQKSV